MKIRKAKNVKKRLEARRNDYRSSLSVAKERGYKEPGSQNPHKTHGRSKKR